MNGNLIVKNASELVTCSGFAAKKGEAMSDLKIIPDGAVVVKEGIIEAVGTTRDILLDLEKSESDLSGFDIIDAKNRAVLPGFVDSHTHLVFAGDRAAEFSARLEGSSLKARSLFDFQALEAMAIHKWPGNVAEVEAVAQQAWVNRAGVDIPHGCAGDAMGCEAAHGA